jgi:hypothetical protein
LLLRTQFDRKLRKFLLCVLHAITVRWASLRHSNTNHFAKFDDGGLKLLVWRLWSFSPVVIVVVVVWTVFNVVVDGPSTAISPRRRLRLS